MLANTNARVLVVCVMVGSWSAPVGAQDDAQHALASARAALSEFDAESSATTDAIAALGQALANEPRGYHAREARFVRAVASADLLLIARQRGDQGLVARVAAAYGTSAERLPSEIRSDLGGLRYGAYEETAVDVIGALDDTRALELPSADVGHTRRQAAFFSRMFSRLLETEDPTVLLARLGDDPCGETNVACPAPYHHYGPRGRRAIAAMTAVFGVVTALEHTSELGDPFSSALAREVLVDTVLLHTMVIAPGDWAPTIQPVVLEAAGRRVNADAVIVLGADAVRVGWVPVIRWDGDGRPFATAEGEPLLADAGRASFPIPSDTRAFVRPIEGLAEHLSRTLAGAERIAIAIEPGAEADVLSRVLRSVEAAQLPLTAMIGVGANANPRGVLFRTRHDDAAPEVNPVGVFVRLGGFSVRSPGASVTLPRVHYEGAWHFDMVGLERATQRRADRPVVLRYMGTAPADLVLRAAFVAAPTDRPLALLVP